MDADVVVIGAGLSGLSAAVALHEHGAKVIVVEARDRVGGRTWSRPVELSDGRTVYCDVGGAYIGPTQHRVLKLAKELGHPTYRVFTEGRNVMSLTKEPQSYRGTVPNVISPFALLDLNALLVALDTMSKQINPEAPWEAAHATEWDSMTIEHWLTKTGWSEEARLLVTASCRIVLFVEPSEISLLFFLWYVASGQGVMRLLESENGAQERKLTKGSQALSEGLQDRLPKNSVHLSVPIARILQTEDDVVVVAHNGKQWRCRSVILAIPPCFYSKITYSPPMPASKAQLGMKMPMGPAFKFNVYYSQPFWRERGFAGSVLSHTGLVCYTFDDCKEKLDDKKGDVYSLVGFITGTQARKCAHLSTEARRDAILLHLKRHFNDQRAMNPIGFLEQDWSSEPWSYGGPTGLPGPKVISELGHTIREPMGRVFFAGTETATKWSGYMDGALQAGDRAANEALLLLHDDGVIEKEPKKWTADIPEDPTWDCVARPIGPSKIERFLPGPGVLILLLVLTIILILLAIIQRGGVFTITPSQN